MKKGLVVLGIVGLVVGWSMALYADGAAVFGAKCKMCHGADGHGNPAMEKTMGPGVNLMNAKGDCVASVTNGKGKMTPFKGKLTDAEISEVCAYAKTLTHH